MAVTPPLSFNVTVTGCNNCPYFREGEQSYHATCTATFFNQVHLARDNYQTITNSCPMIIKQKEELK